MTVVIQVVRDDRRYACSRTPNGNHPWRDGELCRYTVGDPYPPNGGRRPWHMVSGAKRTPVQPEEAARQDPVPLGAGRRGLLLLRGEGQPDRVRPGPLHSGVEGWEQRRGEPPGRLRPCDKEKGSMMPEAFMGKKAG